MLNPAFKMKETENNQYNSSHQLSPNFYQNPKLFDYQNAGVEQMLKRDTTLLADEPGLGKTIQAIEVIKNLYLQNKHNRTLIICPSSLKLNWLREINIWFENNDLEIFVVNKTSDKIPAFSNIIIISYDLLTKLPIFSQLKLYNPTITICDEAHYLKNSKTKRSKAAFSIIRKSTKKILITGTPILNKPIELYPILKHTSPNTIIPYNNYQKFAYRFCNGFQGKWGFDVSGSSNLDDLNKRLRSTIMIRREKEEVLPELPRKTMQIIPFEQNKDTKEIIKKEQEEIQLNNLSFDKLKNQTSLGSIGQLAEVRHELALAKIDEAVSHIKESLSSVNKIVVFAYHRDVCQLLKAKLSEYNPSMLIGGISDKEKQTQIDNFQTQENCKIFIGQINAAGVGITLTKASMVIFVESSWVPSEVNQAIDRCHRIGQKDNVLAQFLVVEGSIDEMMLRSVFRKEKNIKQILK